MELLIPPSDAMLKLLVTLFVIKLYARSKIFGHIRWKHDQEVLKHIPSLEYNRSCLMKTEADISFTREQLTLIFAKVKLSIKSVNRKLQYKITKLAMEAEVKDKHNSNKKIEKCK